MKIIINVTNMTPNVAIFTNMLKFLTAVIHISKAIIIKQVYEYENSEKFMLVSIPLPEPPISINIG